MGFAMNGNFERIRAEERRIAMPALVDDSVRIVAATASSREFITLNLRATSRLARPSRSWRR
jgi:hypothetical protein